MEKVRKEALYSIIQAREISISTGCMWKKYHGITELFFMNLSKHNKNKIYV